jgi:GTPase
MERKMSEGMNADQIERVFSALARIEQKIDGHVDIVKTHMAHDEVVQKAIFERVEVLQAKAATQKGYLTAIGAVSGGVVAALGYMVDRLFFGHH